MSSVAYHMSHVNCYLKHVTCHLTTTLCSCSGYETTRWIVDAAAGGFVIKRVKAIWLKTNFLSVCIQAI